MSMQPGYGGKPHPHPQQHPPQRPQQPYPEHPPQLFPDQPHGHQRPSPDQPQPYGFHEGDSGKSGLVVGLVLGGVFLLIVLLGGGIAVGVYYYAAAEDEEEARDDDDNDGGGSSTNPGSPFKTDNPSTAPNFNTTPQPSVPSVARDSGAPANVDEALQRIKAIGSSHKKTAACEWLATQPRNAGKQATVARALEGQLSSHFVASSAMKALVVWGDQSSVRPVHETLKGRRGDVKSALQLFAKYPDRSLAETTASYLGDGTNDYEAFKTLQAIGKDAVSVVSVHLGSSRGRADEYARQLLETWGVDVADAIIDKHLAGLRSGDPTVAAKALAGVPLKADRQVEVARALDVVVRLENGRGRAEALSALAVWGDQENIPAVIQFFTTVGLGGGKPAIAPLVSFNDDRATEALVSKIGDFFIGKDVRAALVEMGSSCERAVLKRFNAPEGDARNGAREVLEILKTDEKLIREQCIADLSAPEQTRRHLAAEQLGEVTVDEMRRDEVAQLIVPILEAKPAMASKALSRWGTAEQVPAMLQLLQNHDQRVWEPPLRALIELDKHAELAPELHRMLGHIFFREKTPEVLLAIGPPAEGVLIELLEKSEDAKILTKVCTLLATIGSQESVSHLEKLHEKARKFNQQQLAVQSQNALRAIESRSPKSGGPE